MTPSEIERLAVLEQQMTTVCEDVAEMKRDLKKFIASADDRYASKLTQQIVFGAVGIILSTVLLAVVALVVVTA